MTIKNFQKFLIVNFRLSGDNATDIPPLQIHPYFSSGAERRKIFLRIFLIKKILQIPPPPCFPGNFTEGGGVSVALSPDWKKFEIFYCWIHWKIFRKFFTVNFIEKIIRHFFGKFEKKLFVIKKKGESQQFFQENPTRPFVGFWCFFVTIFRWFFMHWIL